ncbi:MAG: hypothetical protein AVDCRST_MAG09-1469 [uncultured Sphingomonas sp.]|uniref:Uncharacterized protein n=1 Tax=uncultured Sphingomonas sp. TaxID=158754 RepID=A0A6J4SYX8_9SPHN|nr:MAG: hypothetical protein AVDCRST_MAG09-1469 [uncultured Sphingomonas sp.]
MAELAFRRYPNRAAGPRSPDENAAIIESHKADSAAPCLWKAGISGATVRL